jgi:hypothetical protein
MPYIGNQPSESFTSFATQEFSTSATTSYTLDHAVTNENEIALFINNVRQQPGSGKAYTATGTALTLSAATASTYTMYCVFLGRALQTVTPATNSITAAMVGNDLISGKDALAATPADTDEFLISDAGTLKRIDYSHIKSGWIKLAETNVTSATASVEFTDATTGVFDGTFRSHVVLITRLVPSNADRTLTLQMRDASDTSYETSSYAYATRGYDSGGNSRSDESTSASAVHILGSGDGMGDGSGKYGTSCIVYCNDFFDDGMPPSIFGHGAYGDSGGYIACNYFAGTYRDTSIQMDGVKFLFNAGNISQGNFKIYGVVE